MSNGFERNSNTCIYIRSKCQTNYWRLWCAALIWIKLNFAFTFCLESRQCHRIGCWESLHEDNQFHLVNIHYGDVIMGAMASQITSPTIVYSTVYSDAGQRKHQSSASLAFVRRIHRDRWIPRTNGLQRGKCFHLMTSSCMSEATPGAMASASRILT